MEEEDFERDKVLVPDLLNFIRTQPQFRVLDMTEAEIHCSGEEIKLLSSELGFRVVWPENEMDHVVSEPEDPVMPEGGELDHDWITDNEDEEDEEDEDEDDDDGVGGGFGGRGHGRNSPRRLAYEDEEEDEEEEDEESNSGDDDGGQRQHLGALENDVVDLLDEEDEDEDLSENGAGREGVDDLSDGDY